MHVFEGKVRNMPGNAAKIHKKTAAATTKKLPVDTKVKLLHFRRRPECVSEGGRRSPWRQLPHRASQARRRTASAESALVRATLFRSVTSRQI